MMVGRDGAGAWAALDASAVSLRVVEYTSAGKTIHDAVGDFPDSAVILNGALFNPSGVPPPKTIGVLVDGGARLSTSIDVPQPLDARRTDILRVVTSRFHFGQTRPAGGMASYRVGGGVPDPATVRAFVAGLVSFILGGHAQTESDDQDLATYFGAGSSANGIGIVGISRAQGFLFFYARTPSLWSLGLRKSHEEIQRELVAMGIEDAVLVDGGSSVALATNGRVALAASRHSNPSLQNTITSYLVFTPRLRMAEAEEATGVA